MTTMNQSYIEGLSAEQILKLAIEITSEAGVENLFDPDEWTHEEMVALIMLHHIDELQIEEQSDELIR